MPEPIWLYESSTCFARQESRRAVALHPAGVPMNLGDLQPGQTGVIQFLDDSDPFLFRLAELGFVPGETVEVLKRAPLGDPLEVKVMESSMCIRMEQARRIEMQTG